MKKFLGYTYFILVQAVLCQFHINTFLSFTILIQACPLPILKFLSCPASRIFVIRNKNFFLPYAYFMNDEPTKLLKIRHLSPCITKGQDQRNKYKTLVYYISSSFIISFYINISNSVLSIISDLTKDHAFALNVLTWMTLNILSLLHVKIHHGQMIMTMDTN